MSLVKTDHRFLGSSVTVLLIAMTIPCVNTQSLSSRLPAAWHHWKAEHGRGYESERDELYRHVIWQSNKKFIDSHNQFNQTFGYTLAMNELGDLVRINCYVHCLMGASGLMGWGILWS